MFFAQVTGPQVEAIFIEILLSPLAKIVLSYDPVLTYRATSRMIGNHNSHSGSPEGEPGVFRCTGWILGESYVFVKYLKQPLVSLRSFLGEVSYITSGDDIYMNDSTKNLYVYHRDNNQSVVYSPLQ